MDKYEIKFGNNPNKQVEADDYVVSDDSRVVDFYQNEERILTVPLQDVVYIEKLEQ